MDEKELKTVYVYCRNNFNNNHEDTKGLTFVDYLSKTICAKFSAPSSKVVSVEDIRQRTEGKGLRMKTCIQLNISAGSTIDEAIDEAFRECVDTKIVSFDFNGIPIAITQQDTKNDILKYWERAMFSQKWYQRY